MKPSEPEIPPLELRWGVGPFDDPEDFLSSGRDDVAIVVRLSGLRPEHSVLEVGCGSGRVALALRAFLSATGSYVGLDPSADYLDWCNGHLAADVRSVFRTV
jgi:ubiquinone/menaquinone biosynthesis C-methylase UbiE